VIELVTYPPYYTPTLTTQPSSDWSSAREPAYLLVKKRTRTEGVAYATPSVLVLPPRVVCSAPAGMPGTPPSTFLDIGLRQLKVEQAARAHLAGALNARLSPQLLHYPLHNRETQPISLGPRLLQAFEGYE